MAEKAHQEKTTTMAMSVSDAAVYRYTITESQFVVGIEVARST
jgi:hypothetical protein